MPDEPDIRLNEDETLAIPGVICVSPSPSGAKRVRTGPAAGWMVPRGIMAWERELSFVFRGDVTAEIASALRATMPHEQIAPKKFAMAARAVRASPLLGISNQLAPDALGLGLRVHTVGVDRVSAGFFYFAEGGPLEPLRVQGNLIEMLAPALKPATTNAEIEELLEGLIDRLLRALSGGKVSELDVELADALPRLSRDGSGLAGTDLEAFDAAARSLALQSAPWESGAKELVDALAAVSSQSSVTHVPLYGEARRVTRAALEVRVGDRSMQLPEETVWTVTGAPREDIAAPARVAEVVPVAEVALRAPAPVAEVVPRAPAPVAEVAPRAPAPVAEVAPRAPEMSVRGVDVSPRVTDVALRGAEMTPRFAQVAPRPAEMAPRTPEPGPIAPAPVVLIASAPAAAEAPPPPVPAVAEVAKEPVVVAPAAAVAEPPAPAAQVPLAASAAIAPEVEAPIALIEPAPETPPAVARPARKDKPVKRSAPIPTALYVVVAILVYFIMRKMHLHLFH